MFPIDRIPFNNLKLVKVKAISRLSEPANASGPGNLKLHDSSMTCHQEPAKFAMLCANTVLNERLKLQQYTKAFSLQMCQI